MCSTNLSSMDKRLKHLNISEDERRETPESEKQSVVLKDDKLDSLAYLDDLSKKFGVSKNKIEEIKNDIIGTCVVASQCNSRLADTINIEKSNKIHVGNVININQQIVIAAEKRQLNLENNKLMKDDLNSENSKFIFYKDCFPMVNRTQWMAQSSAAEIRYLKGPIFYVIICHTSTEMADTEAENIRLVGEFQKYHIEYKGFADIAYNFCIGCDSNVYEGRSWFAEGSHSSSYNAYSVGIAFIGSFHTSLPPPAALKICKDLIAHGVKIGAISPEYELLGHRQCRNFLSPGNCLFNEISTWDHFNPNVKNISPCKLEI